VQAGVPISGQLVNNLHFAVDIDLIAESPGQLQEITHKVNESSRSFGLKINISKTETMTTGKSRKELNVIIENDRLEEMNEFV